MKRNETVFLNEISIFKYLGKMNYHSLLFPIAFILSLLINYFLVLLNLPFQLVATASDVIVFARVSRVQERIKKILPNALIVSDEIRKRDFQIYRYGSRKQRLIFLHTKYFGDSIKELTRVKKSKDLIGRSLAEKLSIYYHVSLRIPHALVYQFSIERVLSNSKSKIAFSGQMYDYFAHIEKIVCSNLGKSLICIPHGIESTAFLPLGYAADLVFCSSQRMAKYLNEMYRATKFKFSYRINEKLYRIHQCNDFMEEKKVVFFTQPLFVDESRQILEKLLFEMDKRGKTLNIKVHPLENAKIYHYPNTKIISNVSQAITNSLCISLASTILLEAKYNYSVSVSFINLIDKIEKKDFYFLWMNEIVLPESFSELCESIDSFLGTNK